MNSKIEEIEQFFEGWEDDWRGFAINAEGELVPVDEIKEIVYYFYNLGYEKGRH